MFASNSPAVIHSHIHCTILHKYIYSNSLTLPSLTFYAPPPRASRGSEIHVFLVIERNSREARSTPLLKVFLWTWRCTTFNSIPIIIFDQYWPIRKSHQIVHSQFVKWERSIVPIISCYLPPFITSPLAFLLTIEGHLPKMDHSWPPLQATPFVRVKMTLSSLRTRKGKMKEEEFTCHYCLKSQISNLYFNSVKKLIRFFVTYKV